MRRAVTAAAALRPIMPVCSFGISGESAAAKKDSGMGLREKLAVVCADLPGAEKSDP